MNGFDVNEIKICLQREGDKERVRERVKWRGSKNIRVR